MTYVNSALARQLTLDAPFAWFLLNQSTKSPLFSLVDLLRLEERLFAYLDAAYLLREDQTILKRLDKEDWGAIFTLAWLGIQAENSNHFQQACELVKTDEQIKELADAVAWFDVEQVAEILNQLWLSGNPKLQTAFFVAADLLGVTGIDKRVLQQGLDSADETLIAACLDYLAHLREGTGLDYSKAKSGSDTLHFLYLKAELLNASAEQQLDWFDPLQRFALQENPQMREALLLLMLIVPEEQLERIVTQILGADYSMRIKLYALGLSGLLTHMDWLFTQMENLEWAPLAGEAFSMLLGVDIEEDDLSLMAVEPNDPADQALLEETPQARKKRDHWAQFYEQDLPFPDTAAIKQWWATHQAQFDPAKRYLAGLEITQENCQQVLCHAKQPARKLAAYYLALAEVDQPLFNISTRPGTQLAQLQSATP